MAGAITTWREGQETLYGDDAVYIHTSDMFVNWEASATTPSLENMTEPVCMERAIHLQEVDPK